jgi:hypothetical protein
MTIASFYLKMFSKHIEYINARENHRLFRYIQPE